VAGLRRRLPATLADEAADGLAETYERHLAAGSGERAAAHAAVAEFGELELVVGEFTRQAPGRRAALMLLATGPVVGACWAAALILGRAWAWRLPGAVLPCFGAVLLLAVMALAVAATSRDSYRRTRVTAAASPAIAMLDAAAIAAVLIAAPAPTWLLGLAVTASLTRIVFTAWSLPRAAIR
jgi:hypothetical protein